jgi:N-methylhydantoinase B/oxoprolinase/acetone carboxylase alpha subunit
VKETLLPGTCCGAGSTGAGLAPGVGGGFTVYAHGGGAWGLPCAKDAGAIAIDEASRIVANKNLFTPRF